MNGTPQDPRAALFARLGSAVLDSPGVLEPAARRSLARGDVDGAGFPPELAAYLRRVDRASYTVTDAEVESLASLTSEEVVHEATVAVAFGAAQRRVDVALELLVEDS